MALGPTHDDPLPEVSRKTLLTYHRYLAAKLKFPFKARSVADGMPLTIQLFLDPKECDLDEEGLLCETRSREGPFDIPLSEVEGSTTKNRGHTVIGPGA